LRLGALLSHGDMVIQIKILFDDPASSLA
jgi:hypothetical protein